jgi:hypothetical protein
MRERPVAWEKKEKRKRKREKGKGKREKGKEKREKGKEKKGRRLGAYCSCPIIAHHGLHFCPHRLHHPH